MMQKRNFLNLFIFLVASNFAVASQDLPTKIESGPKISNYQNVIKEVFPEASHIREVNMLPADSGGSSFMGLVGRLLGEAPSKEFEGLNTRRFIYHIYNQDKSIGVAHGSSAIVNGSRIDIYVFYEAEGNIRKVRVENLSDPLKAQMQAHLKQFEGYSPEDFEVLRGKRGKIKSKGTFFTKARHPANANERAYFDKIFRSVRYNAAFMDVAHFITQHSSADHSERVLAGEPLSGPEAFIRNLEARSPVGAPTQSTR